MSDNQFNKLTEEQMMKFLKWAAKASNEFGAADRLEEFNKNQLRFIYESKAWISWNGQRWQKDKMNTVGTKLYRKALEEWEEAVENAKERIAELGMTDASDKANAQRAAQVGAWMSDITKWIKMARKVASMKNSLEVLSTFGSVATSVLDMDTEEYMIGVKNGVLDLVTGEIIDNDPDLLMLRTCNVEYDPEASCPRWEQFMMEVFEGDAEKVRTMQEVLGSALIGRAKDQFYVLQGTGANGKTTMIQLMDHILGMANGDGYSVATSPRVFVSNKVSTPEYYVARLIGARFLIMSETDVTSTLKSDLVKQVVPDNNEQLTARVPRGEVFEFVPTATPVLLTNNLPSVNDTSDGIWRRLVLVNFNKQFMGPEKDRQLPQKLRQEASGILQWLVKGAQRYIANGDQVELCETIQADTLEWRTDENIITSFLNEFMVADPAYEIRLKNVREKFSDWRGVHWSPQFFRKKLANAGVEVRESGDGGYQHLIGWRWKTDKETPSIGDNVLPFYSE